MAQDADGTQTGRRSAAGPDRDHVDTRSSGRNQNWKSGKTGAKPKRQDGGRKANGEESQFADDANRRGQSAPKGAEGPSGQQSGRKRRRSRSRRNKGDAATQAANQSFGSAQHNVQDARDGAMGQASAAEARTASAIGDQSPQSNVRGTNADSEPSSSNGNKRKRPRRRSRSGRGGDQTKPQRQDGAAPSDKSQTGQGTQQPRKNGAHRPHNAQNRRHTGPGASHNRQSYAALDLGTNNCRLLVAEPHGSSFRVVDAFSRIVRLGEGLSQTGHLSSEAQERAISALKVCQSKLSNRSVKRFRLIATEACRRAGNGAAFLNRVHKETGLRLEIVNRETEARLAVAGCASLVHPEADGVVLFDIGGGSSEIVWLDLDPMDEEGTPQPGEKRNRQTRRALRHLSERIRCWTSLQVGVVTLSEKHGGKLVTRDNFEAMVNDVREMLHQFEEREALAKAIQSKHIHMLGTSGTVTTLAGVHLGLERYDRRQVDGTWLTANELRAMISRVLDMNFEERVNNPCIGQDRADLVLAGCAILEAFHREWPCTQLRVADRGLREGILMEMMIDDGVWTPQQNKKNGSKKRRSRRRGGRGQRGAHGQKQSQTQAERES